MINFGEETHSIETMEAILTLLNQLLRKVVSGEMPSAPREGICFNMYELTGRHKQSDPLEQVSVVQLVSVCSAGWPLSVYPGRRAAFPVPEDIHFGLWEGPNRELRVSLMRYVIKRLRDALRRAKANPGKTIEIKVVTKNRPEEQED